jgi:hypothetical protein
LVPVEESIDTATTTNASTAAVAGKWKDGLFGCFNKGICSSHLWCAWCCRACKYWYIRERKQNKDDLQFFLFLNLQFFSLLLLILFYSNNNFDRQPNIQVP